MVCINTNKRRYRDLRFTHFVNLQEDDSIVATARNRLTSKTSIFLITKKEGRIYIYESLTKPDIEKAMSEEFDRVESMMFIRVPKTDASGAVKKDEQTGKVIYEDDGC